MVKAAQREVYKLERAAAGGNGPGFIVGQCVASGNDSGAARCHVPHADGLAVEYLGWHVLWAASTPLTPSSRVNAFEKLRSGCDIIAE